MRGVDEPRVAGGAKRGVLPPAVPAIARLEVGRQGRLVHLATCAEPAVPRRRRGAAVR